MINFYNSQGNNVGEKNDSDYDTDREAVELKQLAWPRSAVVADIHGRSFVEKYATKLFPQGSERTTRIWR